MLSDSISIIIITYKSKHIIDNCLEDIKNYKNIYIVDNASGDNIKNHIEVNYPNVNFIGLGENIGFSRANNLALKQVETDYALVLNPDAKIKPESIENVIKTMASLPNVAMASPLIINKKKLKTKYKILNAILPKAKFGNQERQISTKIKKLEKRAVRIFEANKNPIENAVLTDFICGCGMFFKMPIMKKVGFFDENIFMYHEDSIISKNVINHGYDNIIVTDSILKHICDASSDSNDDSLNSKLEYFKNWQNGWSNAYFINKYCYKDNFEMATYKNRDYLNKLKIKMFLDKIMRKNNIAIKAHIDGFSDFKQGINPFNKKEILKATNE